MNITCDNNEAGGGGVVKRMKRKAAHLKSYTIVMGLFVSSVILVIMLFFAVYSLL